MASIATYWVLVPRILAALDFARIRDFRVLQEKYSRNMAHDFSFFAKLSEKIKGDTRVCMGNRTYIK